jgi:hypothetical protein
MNTNCKIGNLMLVEVNKQKEDNDLIRCGNSIRQLNDTFKWEFRDYSFSSVAENWKPVLAFIITNEEIKIGDTCYDKVLGIIFQVDETTDLKYVNDSNNKLKPYKILVSFNQFSPSFIQAIINGKVKDGDKVKVDLNFVTITESTENYDDNDIYVNGVKVFSYSHEYVDVLEKEADKYRNKIKLRKDGTATIHPYKETVEEAADKYDTSLTFDLDKEISKLNTPARYDSVKKCYNYSEMDIMGLFVKAERFRSVKKAFIKGSEWEKKNNKL